jgi:hypothetical protein
LRQAYDYWQDQPGNYFPKPLIVAIGYSWRAGGTVHFHDVEFVNFCFMSNIVDPPQLADTFPPIGGGTSDLKPADGVTLFPVLTRLEQDPLVP